MCVSYQGLILSIICFKMYAIFVTTVNPVKNGHSQKDQTNGFPDRLLLNADQKYCRMLNADQKYCRMLQGEHSAILLICIQQ